MKARWSVRLKKPRAKDGPHWLLRARPSKALQELGFRAKAPWSSGFRYPEQEAEAKAYAAQIERAGAGRGPPPRPPHTKIGLS